jgi:hypothetical protein
VIDVGTYNLINTQSRSILRNFQPISAITIESTRRHRPSPSSLTELNDFSIMHQVLGHESTTSPWVETLRILDARRGKPVAPNSVRLSEGRREEIGDRMTAWVDIQVEPGADEVVWIQIGGERKQPSIAVAIPRDERLVIPVRLDVRFRAPVNSAVDRQWMVEAMTTRLGPPDNLSDEARRVWQPLWEIQRIEALADLSSAGRAAEKLGILEATLQQKMECPVGAAIGAASLLRAGTLERLHDWPRNLAGRFPWLSDGPVLWAETLLRRAEGQRADERIPAAKGRRDRSNVLQARARRPEYREALQYFLMITKRGPPLLTPVLGMAGRRIFLWRSLINAKAVSDDNASSLKKACRIVERASTYAISEGLFSTFVSTEKQLSPRDVFGSRQRKPKHPSGKTGRGKAGA